MNESLNQAPEEEVEPASTAADTDGNKPTSLADAIIPNSDLPLDAPSTGSAFLIEPTLGALLVDYLNTSLDATSSADGNPRLDQQITTELAYNIFDVLK